MTRSVALAAFVLCALPRFVVLWLSPAPEQTFYWFYSSTLLEHGSFGFPGAPDTQIEPLYSVFLALARWLTGDRVALVLSLQILVASLGGVLLYRLTASLLNDARAAWLVVFFYAFDPYLVRQSVGLMEVAFLTAILVGVAWSERLSGARGSLLAGLFTGAAVLTRFAFVPVAVAVPLLIARRSRTYAAVAALVIIGTTAPWIIRNYRVDSSFAPSRIGINLAVSMSDAGEQLLPIHNNDRIVPLLEEKTDREHLASALTFATAHPWRTLKMKLRNLVHVFNPRLLPYDHEPATARARFEDGRYFIEGGIPRSLTAQWVHGLWRAGLLVLAIVGLAIRGFRWDDGVLWAVVLTVTAVCMVFYPTTRLTTPMVFAWMVWAAVGARPSV